jgi:hypothetical protein
MLSIYRTVQSSICNKYRFAPFNGTSNSVATYSKLAVALEANKQDAGKVVVLIRLITVWSKKLRLVLCRIWLLSLQTEISSWLLMKEAKWYVFDRSGRFCFYYCNANYAVTTLSFESFSNQLSTLKTSFRIASQLIILPLILNRIHYDICRF